LKLGHSSQPLPAIFLKREEEILLFKPTGGVCFRVHRAG